MIIRVILREEPRFIGEESLKTNTPIQPDPSSLRFPQDDSFDTFYETIVSRYIVNCLYRIYENISGILDQKD